MSSFDYQIQCDELTDYRPTEADLAEYAVWCDEQALAQDAANAWQDAEDALQQGEDDYVWDDEAIEWEEGMRYDNLYDYDGLS